MAAYEAEWAHDCGGLASPPPPEHVEMGARVGTLRDFCRESAVLVVTDTDMYVIAIWQADAQGLLRAFASTFRLPADG